MAYAMKGKYISNRHLQYLINNSRKELRSHSISIHCEVYDGQWLNTCVTTEDGAPLTELQVIKLIWSRVGKLSKEKCIDEMSTACKI